MPTASSNVRLESAFRDKAENICSQRVFRLLTHLGHLVAVGSDSSARLEIILPAVLPLGERRSSGLGRPHAPAAIRAGPTRLSSRAGAAALSRPLLAPPPDGPVSPPRAPARASRPRGQGSGAPPGVPNRGPPRSPRP